MEMRVMKLKREIVVQFREQRAWSQQHLADACGLSLRTIQRVEKSGNASLETIKAIAACLNIEVAKLAERQEQKAQKKTPNYGLHNLRKIAALFSICFSIAASLILASASMASTSFRIEANEVRVDQLTDATEYSGDVKIYIPDDVDFTMFSNADDVDEYPNYRLSIKLKNFSSPDLNTDILISDAEISMEDGGIIVLTESAKTIFAQTKAEKLSDM